MNSHRPRSQARIAVLITLVLAVAPLSAWQERSEDPSARSESGVREKVDVRLVQIPFTARDRQGRPVTDLTRDEMQVKVKGDAMRVAFLEPIAPDPAILDDLPETRMKVDAPGGWDPEDEASAPAVGPARYYVFFVDMVNDYRLGRPEALSQAQRFLEETLRPTDRFAVISYDGEMRLETPFTNELETIRIGLEKAYSRSTGKYVDLTRRMLDLIERLELCQTDSGAYVAQFDESCMKDTAYEYAAQVRPRAEGYVNALDGVVRYLSGVEGRKTVLALSHGFAVSPREDIIGSARAVFGNSTDMIQWLMGLIFDEGPRVDLDRMIRSAVAQGVTLHFIDRNPVPNVDQSARVNAAFQPGGERPVAGAHAAAQADIEEVASSTGGVLVKTLDVYEGLTRAMDLERGAYMLGYYLDRYIPPDRLKRVKVSTERKGVKIAHRRGVYASPEHVDEESTVKSTIAIGDAVPLEEGRGGAFVPFHILAEPRDIGYDLVGDQASSTFSMHVTLAMADGRELRDSYHLIQHAYPRSLWEAEEIEPVVFSGWVELPPGEYVLRAYIRNPNRDTKGIAETAIRIPGA